MEKRGMMSQPFVYIFIIIVIALIFLFGFNMIKKLSSLNEKTVYLTFKSDFEKAVDGLYYKSKGSVLIFDEDSRNKPLRLPSDMEEVCFENGRVELKPDSYDDFNIEHLSVSSNFCVDVENSYLSFRLENVVVGEETYVEISVI